MTEHEPFDFGVTLDGVHHESIRCKACSQAWPCLTARHVEALAALAVASDLADAVSAAHLSMPDYDFTRIMQALGKWRALGVGKVQP